MSIGAFNEAEALGTDQDFMPFLVGYKRAGWACSQASSQESPLAGSLRPKRYLSYLSGVGPNQADVFRGVLPISSGSIADSGGKERLIEVALPIGFQVCTQACWPPVCRNDSMSRSSRRKRVWGLSLGNLSNCSRPEFTPLSKDSAMIALAITRSSNSRP